MADNTTTTPGVGVTIATDDIGNVHYQRVKIVHGADGVNDGDVALGNPMPSLMIPRTLSLTLDSTTPVPTGSDLTDESGNALTSGDFAIRDAVMHYILIPMSGYEKLAIGIDTSGDAFDQDVRFLVYGGFLNNHAYARLLDVTVTATTAARWGVSRHGPGLGGYTGGANPSGQRQYEVPALADYEYVTIGVIASATPTTGSFTLSIFRST